MKPDIVIATDVPSLSGGGERLLQMVRWLKRQGLNVEILSLGEGTDPDLARYRGVAPTTIVDRFRRRGFALLPHLLGLSRLSHGIKTVKLRRWLRKRDDATLLVHGVIAASVVRHAPKPFRRVVAAFPDNMTTLAVLRPIDRETLLQSDGWLTSSDAQSTEIRSVFDGPVIELQGFVGGTGLIDREELPEVSRSTDESGAVVILPTIGMWDSVDHAIEVAWKLHNRVPTRPLRWVVDGKDDRWLTEHDLRHTGLDCCVKVLSSDDPGLLCGAAVVVRTGYSTSHDEVVLAAALGGIPVRGMYTRDLGPSAHQSRRFQVEELIEDLVHLLTHPDEITRSGNALQAELSHLDLHQHLAEVAEMLLPSTSGQPVTG